MPKQVWQAEDGTTFETEEECVAYEKIASVLNDFFDDYRHEKAVDALGLQDGFGSLLQEAFFTPKMLVEYRASFQVLADLLNGRLNL